MGHARIVEKARGCAPGPGWGRGPSPRFVSWEAPLASIAPSAYGVRSALASKATKAATAMLAAVWSVGLAELVQASNAACAAASNCDISATVVALAPGCAA